MLQEKYRRLFPESEAYLWEKVLQTIEQITEIRIRTGKPVLIYRKQRECSIDEQGNLLYEVKNGKRFSYRELQNLMDFWCMDSRYAFQKEISQGFLTLEGGHRIGICGEAVCDGNGKVQSIKYISAVNIRIAHEVPHAADRIMPYICHKNEIRNTLIISPPGGGKTTLLRDMIRQLSYGKLSSQGVTVGLVDERGEIAACYQGVPQLDVGPRTDVLDNCEKVTGMRMLLRAMSPRVIAVDELGNMEEMDLISQMAGTGCAMLATMHGESIEEIMKKDLFQGKKEQKIFQNIVVLNKEEYRFHAKVYQMEDQRLCCSY